MSMKETRKISCVIVEEEDRIKHVTFQNRIKNVSSTSTCSKGRGGPCVECSEGILVYARAMSLTGSDGFKVDSAPVIVEYNLSPKKITFCSFTMLIFFLFANVC